MRIEVIRTPCDAIRLIGRFFSHHDIEDTDESLRGSLASELTDWLVSGFQIDGFGWAMVGAIVLAIVSMVTNRIGAVARKRD